MPLRGRYAPKTKREPDPTGARALKGCNCFPQGSQGGRRFLGAELRKEEATQAGSVEHMGRERAEKFQTISAAVWDMAAHSHPRLCSLGSEGLLFSAVPALSEFHPHLVTYYLHFFFGNRILVL